MSLIEKPSHEEALQIASSLRESELNPAMFIVAGSAIMGLYGLRRPADIDIIMRPPAYDHLARKVEEGVSPTTMSFAIEPVAEGSLATQIKGTPSRADRLALDIHTTWGSAESRERAYYEDFSSKPRVTWEFNLNGRPFSFESLTLQSLYKSKLSTRPKDLRDRRIIRRSGLLDASPDES